MMEVSQATPFGDSAATTLNTSWTMDIANSEDGLRYQQRFLLSLPTGGSAEELLLDATTSLRLRANHLTFNALANDAPEQAQVTKSGATGLLVSLPLPRLISSIRFADSLSPAGKTTQLFRTDGDTVAEEPVASYVNRNLQHVSAKHGKAAHGKADNRVVTGFAEREAMGTSTKHGTGVPVGLPAGELGVVDGRIVVQLKGSTHETLQNTSITAFNLTTGPENLRIGLRIAALGSDPFFLPLTFEINQQVDVGAALLKQLSNLIQRLQALLAEQATTPGPPPLPDPLAVELIVESDAPCQFTLSQFAIRYRLARHSFASGEPKQVLRFAQDAPAQQHLDIEVPSSVTLSHATIRIAGDGAAATAGETADASAGQLSNLLALSEAHALRLDTAHRWSSQLPLSEAMLNSGWDLLVSALTPNALLHLKIVADNNGTPGGEPLATTEAQLSTPHRPQLLRFTLDAPLLLQPGNYWLMVESRNGAAVWHLRPQVGLRTLPWGDNAGDGAVISDQAGIANWIASDGPAAATQRFPEITLADQPLPLSIDGNEWVYDLTPALSTTTANGPALLTTELSILASGLKPVTIYPPRIEYEF